MIPTRPPSPPSPSTTPPLRSGRCPCFGPGSGRHGMYTGRGTERVRGWAPKEKRPGSPLDWTGGITLQSSTVQSSLLRCCQQVYAHTTTSIDREDNSGLGMPLSYDVEEMPPLRVQCQLNGNSRLNKNTCTYHSASIRLSLPTQVIP